MKAPPPISERGSRVGSPNRGIDAFRIDFEVFVLFG